MNALDVLNIVATSLVSIGSGGVIVFSLSSWLGKIWADRLMVSEKAAHAKELEKLRCELQRSTEIELANLKEELDIYKQKHLRGHEDKVQIYRQVVNIISDLLGDLDLHQRTLTDPTDRLKLWDQFNRRRMQAYGYVAMLAPQSVMNTCDALFDHLIQVSNGQMPYEWTKVRPLVLRLLNEVRKDIGFDPSEIDYKGVL